MAIEQTSTGGQDYGLYINGSAVEPESSARLPGINQAAGEIWATISDASTQDVEEAVDAACRCFQSTWSRTSPGTRARLLLRLVEGIERHSAELAEIRYVIMASCCVKCPHNSRACYGPLASSSCLGEKGETRW